ncbi:hypothetical protein HU200_015096 [Digitaria exilis]|uniref:Uncharacterized protein n=1 Tax=Digitaria exilis TaxID=1010633 RepID=A0A835F9Y6_9POAL|nr:hypothetical protein HU200_015096 [Digitaria exilis]
MRMGVWPTRPIMRANGPTRAWRTAMEKGLDSRHAIITAASTRRSLAACVDAAAVAAMAVARELGRLGSLSFFSLAPPMTMLLAQQLLGSRCQRTMHRMGKQAGMPEQQVQIKPAPSGNRIVTRHQIHSWTNMHAILHSQAAAQQKKEKIKSWSNPDKGYHLSLSM